MLRQGNDWTTDALVIDALVIMELLLVLLVVIFWWFVGRPHIRRHVIMKAERRKIDIFFSVWTTIIGASGIADVVRYFFWHTLSR